MSGFSTATPRPWIKERTSAIEGGAVTFYGGENAGEVVMDIAYMDEMSASMANINLALAAVNSLDAADELAEAVEAYFSREAQSDHNVWEGRAHDLRRALTTYRTSREHPVKEEKSG